MARAETAFACGEVKNLILYPTSGEGEVPTNAQVIAFGGGATQTLALRKVIPPQASTAAASASTAEPTSQVDGGSADASTVLASSQDAGAEAVVDTGKIDIDDENLYSNSEYVGAAVHCRTRGFNSVCTASAQLEPLTRYAVWLNDPTFSHEPTTFTTGAGARTPKAVPVLDADVTSVRPGRGTEDCVFLKAGTIDLDFESNGEPWVLFSGNDYDVPQLVTASAKSVTWETVDPAPCFELAQMNWAGEVIATNESVCVPEPGLLDAGIADAAVTLPTDAAAPDAGPTGWELGSVDASPNPVSPLPRDAGSAPDAGTPGGADEDGCGCRAAAQTPPSSAAWASALALALLSHQRRKARPSSDHAARGAR